MTTLELAGITHELEFWMRFVKEKRFLEGWVPENIITPELHPEARRIILECLDGNLNRNVLDVGSGVVSILNGFIPHDHLRAADPLGGLYNLIFDYKKYNLQRPVPVPSEQLGFKEVFHVVHISNALDHTQRPHEAVDSMLEALVDGGYLIVQGFTNEGEHEHYQGFHQWNITMEDNCLMIRDINGKLVDVLGGEADKCILLPINDKRSWYIWTRLKTKSSSPI